MKLRRKIHEQITKRVRRSVQNKELSGEGLNEHIAEIRKALKGWIPAGGMESLRLYELVSAFHILPEGGGWLNQSQWFLEDMENFMVWHELETHLQRRTTLPPGTPGINQVTGQA